MRAEQRDYWSAPSALPGRGTEREDLSVVAISPSVARNLQRQLYSPARLRGGLLFGHQRGETLHIMLASTLGRSAWYGKSRKAMLEVDARFTLGWSEALRDILGGTADWMGNWLMYDDSQMHGQRKDGRWFRSGQRLGLFDEGHVLIVVGWEEGCFACRAYRRDVDGYAEQLAVSHEGRDIAEEIRLNLTDV
ncbi:MULTISPECIES: hypothetical protein [unclassified Deinococcus]|uniref:hypothetical protein n=1 Tax=unclassified Deinococcus TaxID=2623546 RepID=UPI001E35CCB3|nr:MULTISPECIES: hypothetical protein [unclassified Deinococcus]MCD0158221.1 hypothetical protein [Deinococcus sp. 6GRE01]MCD0160221.1 hypothetical protein [Deinococcus sp. 6YEL10]